MSEDFDPAVHMKPKSSHKCRIIIDFDEKKLAEEHWAFLERWLHMIFVDGFVHGYKHAKEEGSGREGEQK